jgi:hypothetical protein
LTKPRQEEEKEKEKDEDSGKEEGGRDGVKGKKGDFALVQIACFVCFVFASMQ